MHRAWFSSKPHQIRIPWTRNPLPVTYHLQAQVQIDPTKLEAMSKWPTPMKKKEVQGLLGFTNYYRRFIANYSSKARPLIDLTQDVLFSWGQVQQQSFNELKQLFLSTPILMQFYRCLEIIIETNASNQGILSILSKYYIVDGVKQLHPTEYHAKTLKAM